MSVNVSKCCKSCPFRKDSSDAFLPETLDATVGKNMREGFAHHCHNTSNKKDPKVCAGFLRFVARERIAVVNVQIGHRLGVFSKVDETAPLIEGSWADVLAEHGRRLGVQ